MNTITHSLLLALGAAVAAPAHGQQPPAPGRAMPATDAFRIPIHTQAADARGGAYGVWASGPDYKVSFHDGIAFHPVLGDSYPENLPLTWRTEAITAGGQSLPAAAAEERRADWRWEIARGSVTEAYDVRPDGIEQTFQVHVRPPAGDLVITGRVETRLECEPAHGHRALTFRDASGRPIVRYGEAFAIDANGARTDVVTSFDGQRIRLIVAGAWLADAAFPVTVDPLTSSVVLGTGSAIAYQPDIARDDAVDQLMVARSRSVSASDHDLYVDVYANDFTGQRNVFNDVNASWSTTDAQIAFHGTQMRWLCAFQRKFSDASTAVRAFFMDSGALSAMNWVNVPEPVNTNPHRPDVGGVQLGGGGSNMLIVYQADATIGNSANTEVYGVLVNAQAMTFSNPFLFAPAVGTRYDRERVRVTQESTGASSSWVCVWQDYDNLSAGDDWDLHAIRVSNGGALSNVTTLGNDSVSDHALDPVVAGQGGRYMVSYAVRANTGTKYIGYTGTSLETHRFDWDDANSLPSRLERRPLTTLATGSLQVGDIAYATTTRSHWAVAFHTVTGSPLQNRTYVHRVGYTGGSVEVRQLLPTAAEVHSPAVTFDNDTAEFAIAYATDETNFPLRGVRLQFQAARSVLYGTGCGPASISSTVPHAGNEFFRMSIGSVQGSKPVALMVAPSSAALPLAGLGMPGCYLNVTTFGMVTVNTSTLSNGGLTLTVPLPDAPALFGDVFAQWVYFDPGSNALGLSATRGLKLEIR